MKTFEELEPHKDALAIHIREFAERNDLSPSEILFIVSICTTDLAYAFNKAFQEASLGSAFRQQSGTKSH